MTSIPFGAAVLCLACSAAQAGGCAAPRQPVRLVELYTSEGCNSCPPADRWLARLTAEPGVVALAYHVDYWDRLGWKDRFASPEFSRRQAQQQTVNGARFSYTPQVVVNGVDRKDWPALAAALPALPEGDSVELRLERDRDRYRAHVRPTTSRRLAAFWAVTENGHRTAVKAGENEGSTLLHDFVVREVTPIAAWRGEPAAESVFEFVPSQPADPAHPREVNLVVLDATTGRPVQARKLGC